MDWYRLARGESRRDYLRREEVQRLKLLRQLYAAQNDVFTELELGKLHFVRWLVQTGRVQVG